MKPYDVLCIGSATIDQTISVQRLPTRDDKVLGKQVSEGVGGTATNSACVCASLGLKVAALGSIGDSAASQLIRAEYRHYGIDQRYLNYSVEFEPMRVLIMLDDSGEKSLIIMPNEPADNFAEGLKQAISDSHYVYTMPGDLELLQRAGELTKVHGSRLAVDIEPTTFSDSHELGVILTSADVAFFNRDGFSKAFGVTPTAEQLAKLAQEHQLLGVVVTLGEGGAIGYVNGEYLSHPGFKVPVVDTTGAGDTFNAAMLYGLLRLPSAQAAMDFASACAAYSVGGVGAKGAVPTLDSVERFLRLG